MRKIQISPLFFRVQGQKCMATPRTSIRGECLWVKMPLHAFLCSFVYTQPPEKNKHGNISSTRYVVMYEVYIKKKSSAALANQDAPSETITPRLTSSRFSSFLVCTPPFAAFLVRGGAELRAQQSRGTAYLGIV